MSTQCSEGISAELQRRLDTVRAHLMERAGLMGAYREALSPEGVEALRLARAGIGSYLWGEPGRGKTWAAACAVRLFLSSNAENPDAAALISVRAFLDSVREGWKDGAQSGSAMRWAQRVPLLALDDIGMEQPTEWATETITALVDARTAAGLPCIFTSNHRLGALRDRWGGVAGARLASRIAGSCVCVEIKGHDRRPEALAARLEALKETQEEPVA